MDDSEFDSDDRLTGKEMSMDELPMDIEHRTTAEQWRAALDKVMPAVVVLRITVCRAFDTDVAGCLVGTGFVVDKRRGIILASRSAVCPGPAVADATFVNGIEIPVYPVYRDPVHDFGFFRYDPAAIQSLNYEDIPLAPEAVYMGLEFRVMGLDSEDRVFISAGILGRLNIGAPNYEKYGYNDFNTFYMQASSGSTSAGAPVIDRHGRAVALSAGGDESSTSVYFLPLERVVRALKFLQGGRDSSTSSWEVVTIPRGTLQATFIHKGFHETSRLLKSEIEELVRHDSPPGETGMLVVDSVVPDGPADKHLEPGDVLVRLNGEVTTQFLKLETVLDDNVGRNVVLQIERGDRSLTVELTVQDLHSITPDCFLEIGEAVIHPLSYHQARHVRFQCGRAYIASQGCMLAAVPRDAIIKKFAGKEISRLEDLISELTTLSGGALVPLEYISNLDHHRILSVMVIIPCHKWHAPPQIYTRNDKSGLWTVRPIWPPEYPLDEDALSADGVSSPDRSLHEHREIISEDLRAVVANVSEADHVVMPTLVRVEVFVPSSCMLDGVESSLSYGTGVIIYQSGSLGLVAVDRKTVELPCSDVGLWFAAYPIGLKGMVVFLHPAHNFTLISYDPSELGAVASKVQAAKLLPEPALRRGDPVCLVGLDENLQVTSRKSFVADPSAALYIGSATIPRYRPINVGVIELGTDTGSTISGVLTDDIGRVRAIWGSFPTELRGGTPIYAINQILGRIISGGDGPSLLINGNKLHMPLVRILEAELYPVLLSVARGFGLSDTWVQKLIEKDPLRHQVLRVEGCFAGSKAKDVLKHGDMVLTINGMPVTCFRDIEDACLDLHGFNDINRKLDMTILRQGKEVDLTVETDVRDGIGTTRAIHWCGCIVQHPYLAVRAFGFLPKEGHGVYVVRCWPGSPVHRYGLFGCQWIVELNGKPTPDLDAFVAVIEGIGHGEFVRVKTIDLNGKPQVLALKQDLHYWPTWEMKFNPETATWHRRTIKALH